MQVPDGYPAPLNQAALAATWGDAWSSIGQRAPPGLLAELMTAWAEPHRRYHDQRHLRECLALWVRWRDQSHRPGELALALWFHDAVYDTRDSEAGGNEMRSAAWAARSLARAGADSDVAQRVYDLVISTVHARQHDAPTAPGLNPDEQLLMDIDLSILGSPAERFERYDQDVRAEYAWVPELRYRQSRAQVLQEFFDRPRLYHGQVARDLLEDQARVNLATVLRRLGQ
jgi:predicted metal-dependent HD superfamily phosphohydrolase